MAERMGRHAAERLGLAALAHDLRTPMCVAAGAAQMALEAGGQDVRAQLEQILQAVRAMDRLLGEAQGEGGTGVFTADMLWRELSMLTVERARNKRQQLSIDLSALEGMQMEADYGALCRVLGNLLGNAVKYTQLGGEITLRAQMEHECRTGDCVRIRFIVADNGQGMTHVFMRRMYQPFVRAKETAAQPGTGLGLSIVREMVRRLNGTIHVRSEWGRGSVFTVVVPVYICGESCVVS